MNPPRDHPPELPDGDHQWLVHCSPERTLVARQNAETTTLVKIFERGSLVEAQEEAELAAHLSQPGVVNYTDAVLDPVTNKPCVRMEFFEGTNLEHQISKSGPLTSGEGAQLILTLAKILADFHFTPRPIAPHGIAHRDVKPANVFLAKGPDATMRPVLIDLEHAIALQQPAQTARAGSSFTGGTHGYSAPESYDGAYPTPAFDVFGLGATFFYVLAGSSAYPQQTPDATADRVRHGSAAFSLLRGHPPVLRDLIESCLARDPGDRPTSSQVVATLEQFLDAQGPSDRTLDQALRAIQAGDTASATDILQAHTESRTETRRQRLAQFASDRSKLLSRIGGAPECEPVEGDDLEESAQRIITDLPRIDGFLRRYPLHPQALEQRQSTLSAGHRLLENVLPRVAAQKSATRLSNSAAS